MKYAELHCASAFSFLRASSAPEELAERAAQQLADPTAYLDAVLGGGAR